MTASTPPILDYAQPRPRRWIGCPLLIPWAAASLLAMLLALMGCLNYNEVAGTDMTAGQIAQAVLGMNLGPFIGPVLASSGFGESFYRYLVPLPTGLLLLAGILLLFLGRRPRPAVQVALWLVHILAALVWFASALLSLAFYLS